MAELLAKRIKDGLGTTKYLLLKNYLKRCQVEVIGDRVLLYLDGRVNPEVCTIDELVEFINDCAN